MSDTPRTNAQAFSATTEKPSSGDYELEVVYAEFARKLERENAELRDELEKLAWDHYTNPIAWPDRLVRLTNPSWVESQNKISPPPP